MNALDPALFAANLDCLPCCNQPGECPCALQMPPAVETVFNNFIGVSIIIDDGKFIDYAEALNAITDFVSNCIGWLWFYSQDAGNINSFSATNPASDTLILASNVTGAGDSQPTYEYASITVPAGCTLSVTYVIGADGGAFFNLYACDDFSTIYFQEAFISGSGSFSTPALVEGTYIIEILTAEGSGGTIESTMTIVGDANFVVNPAIALWDDSGTTRQLEACPKLYLPPLTESSGDWYADCAEGDSVLTDPLQVSNCVGFCGGGPGLSAFTATDGGSSLTLATTGGAGAALWGSINCESGETITVSGTTSTTSAEVQFFIYDYTGTLVDDSGGFVATPAVSAALPYTGRYIILINVIPSGGGAADVSGVITSSGVISVNPVQALYDVGLDCSGRLNCGESCP